MDLVERLDATIDIIQSEGWARFRIGSKLREGLGSRCMVGAWRTVGKEAFPYALFYSAIGDSHRPVKWNDDCAEDRHEVIATLLRMRNDAWREMYG